jgi:lipopolysaccharide transport system permease protein
MQGYLAAVWKCRYFWMALVRMDLRTRYRRSVLGMGWSLLQPIAMTAILCTVFAKLFQQPIAEYGAYVLAGLALWNYIMAVTTHSCLCFFYAESYIRQYPAPLGIYPLRSALGGAIHFLIALGVVIATAWVFKGFGNLRALVSLVPTLLLLLVFGWATAVLMGFATVFFKDTQHLSEVAFQILFYATPVLYKPEMLAQRGMGWLVAYNPLAAFMQLIREPVLEGRFPAWSAIALATATVLATTIAAVFTLWRLQNKLIFRL